MAAACGPPKRSEFSARTRASTSGRHSRMAQTTTGKTKKWTDSLPGRPSPPPSLPVDENC
eukprot:15474534-Alexandrium_andersonii.AAC.1